MSMFEDGAVVGKNIYIIPQKIFILIYIIPEGSSGDRTHDLLFTREAL